MRLHYARKLRCSVFLRRWLLAIGRRRVHLLRWLARRLVLDGTRGTVGAALGLHIQGLYVDPARLLAVRPGELLVELVGVGDVLAVFELCVVSAGIDELVLIFAHLDLWLLFNCVLSCQGFVFLGFVVS